MPSINDFKYGTRVRHVPFARGVPFKGEGVVVRQANRSQVRVLWDSGSSTKQGWKTLALLERAPALRFKVGDKILFKKFATPNDYGTIIQDASMLDTQALVRLDSAVFNQFIDVGFLEKRKPFAAPQNAWTTEGWPKIGMDWAHGLDKTSMHFRLDPKLRKWETSYTKRVGVELLKVRRFIDRFSGDAEPIIDALELLRGYWQDLHIPYQQRDQARVELKGATDVIEDLRNKLAAERLENVKLRETIANGQRALEHKA